MKDYFWPSFSDLMTSLFFIMLVLYILTFAKLKHDQETYRVAAEKYEKLLQIEKSLSSLDKEYFDFDQKNKRYKLNIDVQFKSNSADITKISDGKLRKLKSAGEEIYELIKRLSHEYKDVNYLLVLEGNTARSKNHDGWNHEIIPDKGYKLSYERALALYNFWSKNGYNFRKLNNCEVMIAGSGYFGKSRENDEAKNKRFTIQITGKIGEFK